MGLNDSRLLTKKSRITCRNGVRVVALTAVTYNLPLPIGFILELKNCCFVPVLTLDIISVSALNINGFIITQNNRCCSFSRDGVLYGIGLLKNDLYI